MYTTQAIATSPDLRRKLEQIVVKPADQNRVRQLHGEEFDPVTSWEALRDATDGFTIQNETYLAADAALATWLRQNGMALAAPAPVAQRQKEKPTKTRDDIRDFISALPKTAEEIPDKPIVMGDGRLIVAGLPKYDFVEEKPKTPAKPKRKSYPLVKRWMPLHQQKVVQGFGDDGEREETLDTVERMLSAIPTTRRSDGTPAMKKTVYAHYFYGETDMYVLDGELDNDDPDYDQFFGYVILNGDTQYAELGYSSLKEIRQSRRIELDFYWIPKPLDAVLYERYPDEYPAPVREDTAAADKAKALKIKLAKAKIALVALKIKLLEI